MYKPERFNKRKGVRGCTPSLPSGLPVMIHVGSVQVLPPSRCAQKHNSVSMSTVSVSTGRAGVITTYTDKTVLPRTTQVSIT